MGYLPRDLLMSRGFVRESCEELARIAGELEDAPAAAGRSRDAESRRDGAAALQQRRAARRTAPSGQAFHKTLLPTYDVFDEDRYFEPAAEPQSARTERLAAGHQHLRRRLERPRFLAAPPLPSRPDRGADAERRAGDRQPLGLALYRRQAGCCASGCSARWRESTACPLMIVNQVGGNDDLIFDGRSAAFDAARPAVRPRQGLRGRRAHRGSRRHARARSPKTTSRPKPRSGTRWCSASAITRARPRFRKVLLGLSGGVDSALTAAIAADAMGPENVLGVMMPSVYSSEGSVADSEELARNLGIRTLTLPISGIMKTYDAGAGGRRSAVCRRTSPRRTSSRASAAIC